MSSGGWTVGGGAAELVEVARVRDIPEAEMIRGLLEVDGIASIHEPAVVNGPRLDFGALNPSGGPHRVLVRMEQAQEARALLTEAVIEGEEEAWPEIANAKHLADADGGMPRNYRLVGASVRIFLCSVGFFAVAFAVFMLQRAG